MTEVALKIIQGLEMITDEIEYLIKKTEEFSKEKKNPMSNELKELIEFDFYARIEFLFKEHKKGTNMLKDLIKGETNE